MCRSYYQGAGASWRIFWRECFGASVLAQVLFGASVLAQVLFGASDLARAFWRKSFWSYFFRVIWRDCFGTMHLGAIGCWQFGTNILVQVLLTLRAQWRKLF